MKVKKCRYMEQARTWQEREVGCPLDHCQCGTHDVDTNDMDYVLLKKAGTEMNGKKWKTALDEWLKKVRD